MGIDLGTWRKMVAKRPVGTARSGFRLNTAQFDKSMQKLIRKLLPGYVDEAAGQVGIQLMDDAVWQEPAVPLDEGTLQASGSVFVDEKLVQTSEHVSRGRQMEDPPTPAKQIDVAVPRDRLRVTVGFNTDYAMEVHEHPEWRFQQQKGGEGGKYLEYKLVNNAREYFNLLTSLLRKRMRQQGMIR